VRTARSSGGVRCQRAVKACDLVRETSLLKKTRQVASVHVRYFKIPPCTSAQWVGLPGSGMQTFFCECCSTQHNGDPVKRNSPAPRGTPQEAQSQKKCPSRLCR
jgi:hypothetical protein